MPGDTLDLASFLLLVEEVVGARPLSADANFFDAGGDSLSAAHLVVLLDERWGLTVDVMVVLTASTIRDMYQEFIGAGPVHHLHPTEV